MTSIRVLTLVVLVLLSANWSAIAAPRLALTHVTVIDMTGAPPKQDMTVMIEGQKIISVRPSNETAVSRDSMIARRE